ncbi:hypothetical protein GCM10023075_65880 [Streptosporangium album]
MAVPLLKAVVSGNDRRHSRDRYDCACTKPAPQVSSSRPCHREAERDDTLPPRRMPKGSTTDDADPFYGWSLRDKQCACWANTRPLGCNYATSNARRGTPSIVTSLVRRISPGRDN